MPRSIEKKSEGKHIGHACEGHLRGIVTRAIANEGLSLTRELPFQFHVNPDVVILDSNGRVTTVIIVAYWNNADNSHMKYYRSRSEYSGIVSAVTDHPKHFAKNPTIGVVLYGAQGGWKEKILNDLKTQCAPCFFLPETLGLADAESLTQIAFSIYKPHWQSGKNGSPEHVESEVAAKPKLEPSEKKLLKLIEKLIRDPAYKSKVAVSDDGDKIKALVRLPGGEISTRYRQSLGFLSLFTNEEIAAWISTSGAGLRGEAANNFAIKAYFLGLGSIIERKSIGRNFILFKPHNATRTVAGRTTYAPDLLDFESWKEIPPKSLTGLLDSHRNLTRKPGSVFEGGAFDQCIGNWRGIATELMISLPNLLKALSGGDIDDIQHALLQSNHVEPEATHPANGNARFFPTWALAACAVATARKDRALRSELSARTQSKPTNAQSRILAQELINNSASAALLGEVIPFTRMLLLGNLQAMSSNVAPELLSAENPCSLLKDFYNTLTTNSSHNPLNCSVGDWLRNNYPDLSWHGWPNRRSIALAKIIKSGNGRRQWQFIGINTALKVVTAAEVKSITANHWGDKSKEIYDRVAETRATAKAAGYTLKCIGVFDGDVGRDELNELASGIGYDEVYSIKEVLGIK